MKGIGYKLTYPWFAELYSANRLFCKWKDWAVFPFSWFFMVRWYAYKIELLVGAPWVVNYCSSKDTIPLFSVFVFHLQVKFLRVIHCNNSQMVKKTRMNRLHICVSELVFYPFLCSISLSSHNPSDVLWVFYDHLEGPDPYRLGNTWLNCGKLTLTWLGTTVKCCLHICISIYLIMSYMLNVNV